MPGRTLDIDDIVVKDQLACAIAEKWLEWNMFRQNFLAQKRELKEYIYATDTTTTTNSKLPWTNKTTLPKLTQIRDNLSANYMATMFPKRRWIKWEGVKKVDEDRAKVSAIRDYIYHVVSQREFKEEIRKLTLDYIDYGNCFGTVEWVDQTTIDDQGSKPGYVGPQGS